MNDKLFIQGIQELEDLETLKQLLPKPESNHYFRIMNEIIKAIQEDLYIINEIYETALTEEEKQESIQMKKINEEKLKIIYKHFDIAVETEKTILNDGEKKIMFATNDNGKPQIYKYLKDIEKNDHGEVHADIIELIENLKNEKERFNLEKTKKLSNNKAVRGVFEEKGFQIRLYYMYVGKYPVIIGALQKKCNMDEKTMREIQNMISQTSLYRDELFKNIENELFVENKLKESNEIENIIKGDYYETKNK